MIRLAWQLALPSGENWAQGIVASSKRIFFAVKKENETLKIAIWLCCGLLMGIMLMYALQYFSAHDTSMAKEVDAGAKDAVVLPEESSRQSAVPAQAAQAMQACPTPLSSALAALNSSAQANSQQQQQMQGCVDSNGMLPGTSLSESNSGYPIYTGGRAVDSPPVLVEEGNGYYSEAPPQRVGRNGLLANPCSDPPSAHGLAYGRSYQ